MEKESLTIKEKDKLSIDLEDIMHQMQGISPKLSLYENLKAQADAIREKIGDVPFKPPHLTRVNGITVKARYPLQKPRSICKFPDCKKNVRSYGRDSDGNQKYLSYCGEHKTQAKRNKSTIINNKEKE